MTTAEKPKRSLLSRIISVEGAMAAFGLYSLLSGLLATDEEAALRIFWGVMILGGLCLLIVVRRRDWQKHWAEMEAETAARTKTASPEQTDTTRTEK
jgi:hypothetical protein